MIYLDNAATSYPKPKIVYDTLATFLQTAGGNPGRTGHALSLAAERAVDLARVRVARLFHFRDKHRVVFTLNATDSLNIAIHGVLRPGDHAVTTVLEHNSVNRPLRALADSIHVTFDQAAADRDGFIDPDDIKKLLRPNTRLVVVNHGSNVTGTIQPIRDIGAVARAHGAIFLVDASQTAGVVDIDMERDGVDLLAFTGHKALFGPTGVGALLVREGVTLAASRQGGTGLHSESDLHPAEYPFHLEAGTPNTLGIAGLGAGVQFLLDTGLDKIKAHEDQLMKWFYRELGEDDRFELFASRDLTRKTALLSLRVKRHDPSDVMAILDSSFEIACRAGLHCAPFAHRAIGAFPAGAVRFSPGYFNTTDDIRAACDALRAIADAHPAR